jgi:hypothetical protein
LNSLIHQKISMSSSITLLHHNRSKDGINLDQPAKVSTKAIIIILQIINNHP